MSLSGGMVHAWLESKGTVSGPRLIGCEGQGLERQWFLYRDDNTVACFHWSILYPMWYSVPSVV